MISQKIYEKPLSRAPSDGAGNMLSNPLGVWESLCYKHNVKPLFSTEFRKKVAKHIVAIHDMPSYKECEPDEYK